ncbi:MAG TPA: arabinogalactan endo-1,4-beta-galactosidase [Candidatus Limnocylindrales bacterium]
MPSRLSALCGVPRGVRRDVLCGVRRGVRRGARVRALAVVFVLALAAAVAGPFVAAQPASAAATVTNPGFESNGASQTPTAWSESGTVAASKSEAGGRSGSYQLAHWASSAYTVETFQTLTGLTPGSYTLAAWVRSGGGQATARIALRDCGAAAAQAPIPASGGTWVQISTSANVTATSCTISIYSNASANNWINVDDVTFTPAGGGGTALQIKGGDVSTLKKNEDFGGAYFTAGGQRADPLTILRSAGMNYGRLKVWVNPADGYNNKARVLTMASRIKAQGMKLLIDFHYSDSWADPGKQVKPAAWANLSLTQLRQAVYDHTFDVLNSLKNQGTTADMVQIGNEINPGMLLPTGSTNNWANLAQLLSSGISAAKAVSSSTLIMLHLAEGGNNSLFRWWFDQATSRGVQFDVIGASFYCYWHGSLSSLQANLNDISARYGKPVVVVETAYGFTLQQKDSEPNIFNSSLQQACGYPATPQGQTDAVRAVLNVVRNVPNQRGLGFFYWEPTWTAVTGAGWDPANPSSGNGWENQALFDYNSRALPAMSIFG